MSREAETGLLVSGGGVAEVLDCEFENNGTGLATGGSTGPRLFVHKTLIRNNTVGIEVSANSIAGALLDADDPANPNAIENNGAGLIDTQQFGSVPPQAAHNWWGDPSGPQHPSNPGGTGDSADPVAQVLPFETTRPDFTDHPPVVDMMALGGPMRTGERFILRWSATDDGAIVSQRVLYGPSGQFAPFQTVVELDGSARAVELTMPAPDPGSTGTAIWRVVAVDDAGQEGWDDKALPPVDPNSVSDLAVTTDLSAGVQPGALFDLHWSGPPSGEMQIQFTGQRTFVRLGGVVGGELPAMQNEIPAVSTDMARYVLTGTFNGRVRNFFGPFFTIRPPDAFGDAPPVVTMTSPSAGEGFFGGTMIPITWDASDDIALAGFDIQASYNGGLAWHDIVRDLPPSARSFNLALPASNGISDVRIRVIARDSAFQLSSDGGDVPVTILPGNGLPGDIDGDGDVDLIDLSLLLNAFGTCSGDAGFEPAADFDGSGCVDLVDLSTLLGSFGA